MSDVKVSDVMTRLVVMLHPQETVHEAARRLARNRISGAPVVKDGVPIGMVSEADLLRAVLPQAQVGGKGPGVLAALETLLLSKVELQDAPLTVDVVMSAPVVRIAPEASVWRAAEVMERAGIKRLPVVDEHDEIIGIVSRADLVKAMAKDDATIARDVTEAILVLGEENFRSLHVRSEQGRATVTGLADRRSTRDLSIRIAARVPGVVDVVDRLDFSWDDSNGSPAPLKDPRYDWMPNPAATEVGR